MFQDLMNMEGVAVLSKKQQISIQGGGQCNLTVFDSNGNSEVWLHFTSAEDEQGQTNFAHQECAGHLNGGSSRCFYDCSYDGIGTGLNP
jgi:hypothetical protein